MCDVRLDEECANTSQLLVSINFSKAKFLSTKLMKTERQAYDTQTMEVSSDKAGNGRKGTYGSNTATARLANRAPRMGMTIRG